MKDKSNLKESIISLRNSPLETATLKNAKKKLEQETGEPQSISKTIRHSVQQYSDETPFWVNKAALENIDMNIKHCKKLIQDAVSEWDKLCPVPITLDELQSCLGPDPMRKPDEERIEGLIINKFLKGKTIDPISGLKFNVAALRAQIDVPDYSLFLQTMERFGALIPAKIYSQNQTDYVFWQFYNLKDSMVTLNTVTIETYKSSYQVFAITDEEKQRLEKVVEICEVMNNFIKHEPGVKPETLVNRNLIIYDDEKGIFTASEIFVKYAKV